MIKDGERAIARAALRFLAMEGATKERMVHQKGEGRVGEFLNTGNLARSPQQRSRLEALGEIPGLDLAQKSTWAR